ncbi:MAG: Flp pilus assembly complex ATPase component TadA [Deltaproteobacteria bacterium]|nr:Flp pilus assembly complex ATPase component TadA [Deltaproteobacteria bacterium]
MAKYALWKEWDQKIDKAVEAALIQSADLEQARADQKRNADFSLIELLITAGKLDKNAITVLIADDLDVPFVNPSNEKIDKAALEKIPAHAARQFKFFPFAMDGERLRIVMADPRNQSALEELMRLYQGEIEVCLGVDDHISEAILKNYAVESLNQPCDVTVQITNFSKIMDDLGQDSIQNGDEVVNIANNILAMALNEKASDIHLDPIASGLRVRFRIDGTVHDIQTVDKELQLAVLSRIKVLADLDISEKRIPQDGRTRVQIGNRIVDLRIATYPTMWGEKVSIRVLTKDVGLTLDSLGLSKKDQEIFENIITQPHGFFLVTGPTGSGKTTTLYTAFNKLNLNEKNTLSIEDPIENEIVGVNQAQVNTKAGVTFANALRSMLRHDPDIVLVGEIRDSETADITARAAMTGHLVFSTLHTNSALGTVTRLKDLGLQTYLLSNSLIGMMAQRLLRKICSHCKETHEPTAEEREKAGDKVQTFYHGKGCEHCHNTGFSGRLGIFEVVAVDDELRDAINNHKSEVELLKLARDQGFTSMWEDALDKVAQGVTSLAEAVRVCREI